MQKLVLLPIASTLVGVGWIAIALHQGDRPAQATSAIAGQLSYEAAGFDRVSAAGPMHVLVTVGPAASVRGEGLDETLDGYEVKVEHGSLEIKPKPRNFWNPGWKELKPATFRVTLPRLSSTSIAGSGDMKVDRVDGSRFAASVAGSGKFEIDSLAVDEGRFSVAGSGELTARGRAGKANVSIAGSGNMHLRELASDDANVSIVGSGDAALTVRDAAAVSIIGSGEADVAGSAHCSVSRFGGGRVRCNGQTQGGKDG